MVLFEIKFPLWIWVGIVLLIATQAYLAATNHRRLWLSLWVAGPIAAAFCYIYLLIAAALESTAHHNVFPSVAGEGFVVLMVAGLEWCLVALVGYCIGKLLGFLWRRKRQAKL